MDKTRRGEADEPEAMDHEGPKSASHIRGGERSESTEELERSERNGVRAEGRFEAEHGPPPPMERAHGRRAKSRFASSSIRRTLRAQGSRAPAGTGTVTGLPIALAELRP